MLKHPQVFIARGCEALFPHTGTLGCVICLTPQLFLLDYPHTNVGLSSPPATALPSWFSSHHLTAHPLHLGCPSLPLLPVWMDVSSLTPWLSDFHTVQFYSSSGYFLFLDLLLSFFWLCEETKCILLCLHLGRKSQVNLDPPNILKDQWNVNIHFKKVQNFGFF